MAKSIKSILHIFIGALTLAVIASVVFSTGKAQAAGTVTSCDEAAFNVALSGGGLVTFDCDGTIDINSTNTISADTIIDARGHNVILDGGNSVQLFSITSGTALTLTHVILQNGAASSGGAISMRNGGTLVIEDSEFINNTAGNFGGAIYVDVPPPPDSPTPAFITITRTLFENNTALSEGGAIRIDGGDGLQYSGAYLEISDSTFRNNQADISDSSAIGGAIRANYHVTLNIEGTLFEGNRAGNTGGALFTLNQVSPYNIVNLANNTFSGNSAGYARLSTERISGAVASLDYSNVVHNTFVGNYFAGGDPTRNRGIDIYWPDGTFVARDNIFSNNTGGVSECFKSTSASSSSFTNNLTSDGTCNDPAGGSAVTLLDTTLQNNGGLNETYALLSGSNAIDNSSSCTYVSSGTNNLFTNGDPILRDQRNMARPYNGNCDIGAYEYRAPIQYCSISEGNAYTFGDVEIAVPIGGGGDIDCLTVEEASTDHPAYTGSNGTGNWWHITAINTGGNPASGFSVALTLPHSGLSNPRLCRYPGNSGGYGWDCFPPQVSDSTTATLNNVTTFSDWMITENVGPTAIDLKSLKAQSTSDPYLMFALIAALIAPFGLLLYKRKTSLKEGSYR